MPHLNRFQLTLNEDYSDYHTSGFSGSGVFVNLNGAVYLLGIFTRFRAEEKGRVIYCQYIEKINELLKRSHLPLINFSYTAGYGLTPLFFINQVEASIANLGPRFSEKLNFKLYSTVDDNLARQYWTSKYCYHPDPMAFGKDRKLK